MKPEVGIGRLISNIVYGNQELSANSKARISKNPTLARLTLIGKPGFLEWMKDESDLRTYASARIQRGPFFILHPSSLGSWRNPQKSKKKTLSHTSLTG